MSFGHFWLTQLPDVRTIHSSRCTLIWAAGTSKFTLGLAFHNLPMGLSAWFNNGGIISSTFTYFYDEVWLMKIDEVWWNMRTFLDVVSCLQSQDTSKKYQKTILNIFFGKKAILWLPSVVSLIPEPLIPLNAPASSEAGFAATSPVHQKANSEGYSVYLSLPVAFTKSCSPKYYI